MVSLDHNGQSTRVVCIGGRNVITLGRAGEGADPITVTNVAWPGVIALLGFAALGIAIGAYWSETLMSLLP